MDGGEGDLNLDICRMCVDKNTIHWKGVIKHTTMHVYTETISIDKLFHKFINSKITGSNNSTDYEELRLIADHAVEGFDTDTCVTLAYDYVLNFLDSCTNIELEKLSTFTSAATSMTLAQQACFPLNPSNNAKLRHDRFPLIRKFPLQYKSSTPQFDAKNYQAPWLKE